MIQRLLTFLVLIASAACGPMAYGQELVPRQHADFGHYTYALTWQPGFCTVGKGCLADQPRDALIGLHGLWASRPQTLITRNVPRETWWRDGCDLFQSTREAPKLATDLQSDLHRVMPHLSDDLLTHEYDKHVQCFRFPTEAFFRMELAMRDKVVLSRFGAYLVAQVGHDVTREAVVAAFNSGFGTHAARAVQLRCEADRGGHMVLTQFWMTIRTRELSRFPAADVFEDSPVVQGNCPATFTIPAW